MGDVEHEEGTVIASRAEAIRARARGWFAPTGTPPAFAGVGLSPAYAIAGRGLTSIGSILMAGAPTGDVTAWAGNRLLDTVLGCAIALAATYLLWPRDRASQEVIPVPAT